MTYQIQSTFDENFKVIPTADPTAQDLTTSYEDVPTSHIDYLPSPNSSFVVYHFSFYFARSGSSGTELNCQFKLQYSNDNGLNWSDWGDNTECYLGSAGTYSRHRTVVDMKWALSTTGWTSAKRLRVLGLEDTGSAVRLHQLEDFLDSTGTLSGNHKYGCSVSCYSVE